MNYKKWIWGVHLLFWLVLITLLAFVHDLFLEERKAAIIATGVNTFGYVILIYGHLLYLLPKYFDKKQYTKYALGLLILLTLTSAIRFFFGWGLVSQLDLSVEEKFTPTYLGSMFFGGTLFLLISIPLRLIDNWFKKSELEKELKTHQLEAELRFLKAQVNPHFLFNALNNIYSLSFTESKKTPEMILKLSDMMSYMLYDCKSEKVKLASEIEYLKNYIALQQLKKDGEFKIEFNVSGDLTNVMITPMLFIPFFENAFKHGNLEDTEYGWLKSSLNVENGGVDFRILNSLKLERKKYEKGGVGLENVRERLKLLYPENHELNIKQGKNEFSVKLKINLTSQ